MNYFQVENFRVLGHLRNNRINIKLKFQTQRPKKANFMYISIIMNWILNRNNSNLKNTSKTINSYLIAHRQEWAVNEYICSTSCCYLKSFFMLWIEFIWFYLVNKVTIPMKMRTNSRRISTMYHHICYHQIWKTMKGQREEWGTEILLN